MASEVQGKHGGTSKKGGTSGRSTSTWGNGGPSTKQESSNSPVASVTAPSLAGDILKDPTISRDQTFGGTIREEKLARFAGTDKTAGSLYARSRRPPKPTQLRPRPARIVRRRSHSSNFSYMPIAPSIEPHYRVYEDYDPHEIDHLNGLQSDYKSGSIASARTQTRHMEPKAEHDMESGPYSSEEEGIEDSPWDSRDHAALPSQVLLDRIKALEQENNDLKRTEPSNSAPLPHYTWRTLHAIGEDIYLEPPQWKEGEDGPSLQANLPLQNVAHYLEQHPEITFIFYKDYKQQPPKDPAQIISKDGVFRPAEPFRESLSLISEHIISAVEIVAQRLPEFYDLFPEIDLQKEIRAPYLFAYYSIPFFKKIQSYLSPLQNDLLSQLTDSILASHGKEYMEANRLSDKGVVTRRLMKYLVRPGDVLVKKDPVTPRAYMATTWATEDTEDKSGFDPISDEFKEAQNQKMRTKRGLSSVLPEKKKYSWNVEAWSWSFDGVFTRTTAVIHIFLYVSGDDIQVHINDLNYYPIKYGSSELQTLLETRGRMFWKCRNRHFVSYQEENHGVLNSGNERYMVDIETYKTLHPDSEIAQSEYHADIDAKDMARDDPPKGDSILLFPHMLIGYELRRKKWVDLLVDRISDVTWNKKAFESLVVNEKTKELVQALITNQLAIEKSTDIIDGKGNGLTILLHGGPGTGKTFTAEGVAEIAEKPLLRVTCGDVATDSEFTEKYLEAVFELGKVWDCVVLLDEADVFLEERRLADLERNALVSVFLRVLEYNVGILILTSNRVGTFDEAFKSRIQLALHYKKLTTSQQKKIWRNFLGRLNQLDPETIDHEDIIDHIDELGQEDMNGRQIRNVITTARQLALYKGKRFCYEHLRHAIDVSGEFEQYLKTLRLGLSDDQIKQEEGLR